MKQLFNEFNKLRSDKERWLWIKDHQSVGITIYLDNDDTFGAFDDDEDGEFRLCFVNYLGWSEGMQILLDALGIEAEGV